MASKKYTHLFFDLDNTIWDFNSNSFDALYIALDKLQLLKKIGSYEVFFLIYENVNAELWERYRQGLITKKDLSVQRFEASFEKHGTPLSFGGGIVNEAYLTEMPFQTKLVEGARKVLEYLHGRYEMAIITNGFKEVQYEKIHKSELSKYFRKIFISEEIGAQKPGRKIFEYAIKSMNAPKKSTLMIGDSWEADIVGAMNFGIDQIYYNPKLNHTDPKVNENTIINHGLDPVTEGEIPLQNSNLLGIINKKVSTTVISDLHQLISRL
jgi:YjjG family noncanonical pyrimidine nucleotidase